MVKRRQREGHKRQMRLRPRLAITRWAIRRRQRSRSESLMSSKSTFAALQLEAEELLPANM